MSGRAFVREGLCPPIQFTRQDSLLTSAAFSRLSQTLGMPGRNISACQIYKWSQYKEYHMMGVLFVKSLLGNECFNSPNLRGNGQLNARDQTRAYNSDCNVWLLFNNVMRISPPLDFLKHFATQKFNFFQHYLWQHCRIYQFVRMIYLNLQPFLRC